MQFWRNSGAAGRFRNIRNATRPWLPSRKRAKEGRGATPDVRLTSGGRWRRDEAGGWLDAQAAGYLALLGIAAVCTFGIRRGSESDVRIAMAHVFLIVCALVALAALWSGRAPRWRKIVLTAPLAGLLVLAFT